VARVAVSTGAPDAVSSDGSRCRRHVDLPFEAYGKRLQIHLQPEAFKASDTVFSNANLELAIRRPRRPRPAADATPKPCVPPDYCRN
jgi:hypothetical protein